MGFLGWTYDQTENTPFGAIETAYEGRMEMLRMCFGGEEKPEAPPSGEAIRSVFRMAAAGDPNRRRP
jgi:hypothetical protein